MGFGIMHYWINSKIFIGRKIKNDPYPFKNQPSSIPPFHYSMVDTSNETKRRYYCFQ
jgi:hypothetical protein